MRCHCHGIAVKLKRRHVGEVRAEGRRLSGIVMAYGDVSPSHRERFEPGALRMAEAVHLDLQHDVMRAVAWHPGGGLELRQDGKALSMVAELPPIPAADRALELVRSGATTGLSVEFRAMKERRDGALRVIEAAMLTGIGLVRSPSYEQSQVEARRRSGRTMRATIPADQEVECRCSGVQCKFARITGEAMQDAFDKAFQQFEREVIAGFARITGEAMQDAFDKAFQQFEREVIAGFGGYDMPLASVSSGTLRGRVLGNGDGEVEIDLPDDTNGAATVAAHDAAGVIVRPHIDGQDAVSTVEGETRIYTSAPLRAFLVSATDARQGWPAPVLAATPEELAAASAPRRRLARWL